MPICAWLQLQLPDVFGEVFIFIFTNFLSWSVSRILFPYQLVMHPAILLQAEVTCLVLTGLIFSLSTAMWLVCSHIYL